MAKLKNIIKQLSEEDFQAIYKSLTEHNADKSAQLIKSMREKQLPDFKIMEELEVNTNAYYTLRSRLNQKIEEYLLRQMESPRTDLMKKVANIHEIVFTKKNAIAIATLKKLEKELLDYDLSNELTVVYKNLKKLHLNTPEYFHYSQNYNRHIAYMLAVDKAEDILSEYFKKYGSFLLSENEIEKIGLVALKKEMDNIAALYQSHRLYVYQSCLKIYHRLFVDKAESENREDEPIEDILNNVEKIFEQYYLDSIYYHLKLIFEYLKLEYYNHYKVYRKAEKYLEEVEPKATTLLSNFSHFTFPAQFLLTKIDRSLRLNSEDQLYDENLILFEDYESNQSDVAKHLIYVLYRTSGCYYAGKYEEAAKWINNLLNDLSLKKFPIALLEVKCILALLYCLMRDNELFNQLVNSIQRQVRLIGKEECVHTVVFIKILKYSIGSSGKTRESKIRALVNRFNKLNKPGFSLARFIRIDDEFSENLI